MAALTFSALSAVSANRAASARTLSHMAGPKVRLSGSVSDALARILSTCGLAVWSAASAAFARFRRSTAESVDVACPDGRWSRKSQRRVSGGSRPAVVTWGKGAAVEH